MSTNKSGFAVGGLKSESEEVLTNVESVESTEQVETVEEPVVEQDSETVTAPGKPTSGGGDSDTSTTVIF